MLYLIGGARGAAVKGDLVLSKGYFFAWWGRGRGVRQWMGSQGGTEIASVCRSPATFCRDMAAGGRRILLSRRDTCLWGLDA